MTVHSRYPLMQLQAAEAEYDRVAGLLFRQCSLRTSHMPELRHRRGTRHRHSMLKSMDRLLSLGGSVEDGTTNQRSGAASRQG